MKNRGMSRYSSSLAILCYIDTSSELLMDCFCLLTNLWMVFGTSKPLEMILNSLALEFIKSIDNEFTSFFIKEYPAIVTEIEKCLRVRYTTEMKLQILLNPDDYVYGRLCLAPAVFGFELFDNVTDRIKEFIEDNPKWLWYSPLLLILEIIVFAIFLFGISIPIFFYFVPLFLWLFFFKYVLVVVRKISVWLTFLTPILIFFILVAAPVCKSISEKKLE